MLVIISGCFLSSLGVNLFLSNAKLLSGGVTGIALILEYSFNIQSGLIVMLINIPLLLLSYKFLSKKFTFYTTVGMFSYSIFLMLTKQLSQFIKVDDALVLCIYGGLLSGIGAGLILYITFFFYLLAVFLSIVENSSYCRSHGRTRVKK